MKQRITELEAKNTEIPELRKKFAEVDVIAAKKAGVSGYIVKPFNAEMLKVKIEAAFATRAKALGERPAMSMSPRASAASDTTPDTPQLNFWDVLPATLKCNAR